LLRKELLHSPHLSSERLSSAQMNPTGADPS